MRWSAVEYAQKVEAELQDYRTRYLILAAEIAHALNASEPWAETFYETLTDDNPDTLPPSVREFVRDRHACAADIERIASRFPPAGG
jgi:hypothetical protein